MGVSPRSNIRDVASHRYFYSPPDGQQAVERAIGELEGPWIELQDELLRRSAVRSERKGPLSRKLFYKRDKEDLAGAVTLQLVRTTRVRERLGVADTERAREAHAAFMVDPTTVSLAPMMTSGIWTLGANDPDQTGHMLYTSDHPVCVIPDHSAAPEGYGRVGSFIFPLSPTRILLIYAPGCSPFPRERDGWMVPLNLDDVVWCNTLQANSAERAVVSCSDDFRIAKTVRAKRRIESQRH